MEELTREELEALRELAGEPVEFAGMEDLLVDNLTSRGLIQNLKTNTIMKTRILPLAASVALFLIGYWFGNFQTSDDQTPMNMNKYALFLYENNEFEVTDIDRLVSEYYQWAEGLGKEGKLIAAEKLNDNEKVWLGKPSVENQTSALSGYFIYYAKDLKEAEAIAKTHPHTSYGGGLELRPIEEVEE